MSLSKFYKSPTAFKPQTLVTDQTQKNQGWEQTPLPSITPSPFAPDDKVKEYSKSFPAADPAQPSKNIPEEVGELLLTTDQPSSPSTSPPLEAKVVSPPEGYLSPAEIVKKEALAFQQGKSEGITEGRRQITEDYESATTALLSICKQLETCRETLVANSGQELQDFALAIAERVIRYSVENNDKTIIATIEEALQRSIKSDEFYVFVNPEDYDTIASKSEDIISGVSGLNNIVIKKDSKIERGGARIESENCILDATITSQFELIKEEIQKRS